MASTLHNLLISLVFLSTIFDYPTTTTSQQECPYPCYPPPTGPGNNPPVITTPPVSTTPPASFSPPVFSTPPAIGNFPFNPPSPYFSGVTPPPPEPILPWFPYYFRKPPHQDPSNSIASRGSSATAIIIIIFSFLFVFSFALN
ncbi:hypothetical protein BUALT_Bualt05G0112900 [Buddleja alternifolia]|uniref:Uncharacterized protein n=1 Tax=Buddleja alternifolia TaxID=168488 RepID=A0AAV6XU62_9LAMI|nr:hypothetical protein BUALT_Bualt05G0112900 [Buddleja alternifolia]